MTSIGLSSTYTLANKNVLYKTHRPFSLVNVQNIPKEENNKTSENDSETQINQHRLVEEGKEKAVGWWLLLTAGTVFFMIILGGYTRLSHSGLSMVRWRPINYVLPSSTEEWETEYEQYKLFPEYQLSPETCDMKHFKFIFFIEWAHRTLGNIIGVEFTVPMVYFWARGYLKRPMKLRLAGLFCFGLTQGLVGWWMVKSGLTAKPDYQSRPRVSTYRLFVHLNNAIIIYSFLLWNGLTLVSPKQESILSLKNFKHCEKVRKITICIIAALALNVMSGVTVAGIDAGKVFNTWPLMNGAFMPNGYWKWGLGWRNCFENLSCAQFNHRNLAYVTYALSTYALFRYGNLPIPLKSKRALILLFIAVNYQLAIGIYLVLNQVPLFWGCNHQANGLVTLSLAIALLNGVRRPNPAHLAKLRNLYKIQGANKISNL